MRLITSMIALVACCGSFPALAESTADALGAIGLIGTWSKDCALDPMHGGSRVTYTSPIFGPSKVTSVSSVGSIVHTMEFEIKSATRVTEDKIILTEVLISAKSSDQNENWSVPDQEIVIQKIGKRYRLIHARTLDRYKQEPVKDGLTQNGQPTPLIEKCLN